LYRPHRFKLKITPGESCRSTGQQQGLESPAEIHNQRLSKHLTALAGEAYLYSCLSRGVLLMEVQYSAESGALMQVYIDNQGKK
jgi:hypothetical protein